MVRFVADLVEIDRAAALERLATASQGTLLKSEMVFAKQIGGRATAVSPEEVADFFRSIIDGDDAVSVLDESGRLVGGNARGAGALLAQGALHNLSLPWTVEIFLANPVPLNA